MGAYAAMTSSRIAIIREAIDKVTNILSGRGIKVTQRGMKAFVESDDAGKPLRVNLPFLPDTASDELVAAVQGFLDHEVAHLLFTDFNAVRDAHNESPNLGSTHNFCEDVYIERKMRQKFKGSNKNFTVLSEFFCKKFLDPQLEKAREVDTPECYFGNLMAAIVRAWAGDENYQEYLEDGDKWSLVKAVTDRVPASVIERFPKIKDSYDALDLARELNKALFEDPEDDSENNSDGEKGDGNSEKGESEDESGNDESEGEPEGEPEPEEDDPESEDQDESEGEPESEDEGEDEGEEDSKDSQKAGDKPESGEEENQEDSSGDDENGESSSSVSDEEEEGSESEQEEQFEDDKEEVKEQWKPSESQTFQEVSSFEDGITQVISDYAGDAAELSDYTVYTTDWDEIEPAPEYPSDTSRRNGKPCGVEVNRVDGLMLEYSDKVKAVAGQMQKGLERAFVARNRAFWQPGLKSGSLNPSSLAKIRTGDMRVFRRKQEIKTKNTSVQLVVDCSGSMAGSKIKNAMLSAWAMSEALERLKIPNEIIGFTTNWDCDRDNSDEINEVVHDAWYNGGTRYSRMGGIYMPLFKGFSESLTAKQKRRMITCVRGGYLACNVDGESLLYAFSRLAQQKEEKKVMIVLSDGAPAGQGGSNNDQLSQHLKKVVKDIERSGTHIVGLGIESENVHNYYSKSISFNDVDQLTTHVMKELQEALLG